MRIDTLLLDLLLSARVFHRHGVLVAVDEKDRTLVLQTAPSVSNTYAWNDATEFLQGESKVSPELPPRGTRMVVFYRGGFFFGLRTAVSVKWKSPAPN